MTRTALRLSAVAGILSLAACGGSTDGGASTSSTPVKTTSSASSSSASSTTSATESADAPASDEPSAPYDLSYKVPFGESYVDGVRAKGDLQDITLKSSECGATVIKEGTSNDAGERMDYKPDPGNHFCIVKGTSKNTGRGPLESVTNLDQVQGSDGLTYEASYDDADAASWTAPEGTVATGYMVDGFNPGETLNWVAIYQLPVGVTVAAVVAEDDFGAPIAYLQTK